MLQVPSTAVRSCAMPARHVVQSNAPPPAAAGCPMPEWLPSVPELAPRQLISSSRLCGTPHSFAAQQLDPPPHHYFTPNLPSPLLLLLNPTADVVVCAAVQAVDAELLLLLPGLSR